MIKVTVSRKSHFNAAHRLHNKDWGSEQNGQVFGKCANPYYHGHNYEVIAAVKGPIDPETGYVIDMKVLKDILKEEVEDPFDHKNLNEQVEDFKNINPTAENICVVIYDRMKKKLDSSLVLKITMHETPRNFVEYSG